MTADHASASRPPSEQTLPICPITGRPARRRIQFVTKALLRGIWKVGAGVDVRRFFQHPERIGLYESDCGLVFFHPRNPGDEEFYRKFYTRYDVHRLLNYHAETRVEYVEAARHIPRGALVLDVGCGGGDFRHHLAHASFRGIDPYPPANADASVLRQTLEEHLKTHAGAYDVVTAFQVIEHVAEPRSFAAEMVKLLKPGGLLILCGPLHPSPLTEIPNLIINIPPHHFTWWSPRSFRALAEAIGLELVTATELPTSPGQGPFLWVHRLLPFRTDPPPNECYFDNRYHWHLGLISAFALAWLISRFKQSPADTRPIDVMLVARKPK